MEINDKEYGKSPKKRQKITATGEKEEVSICNLTNLLHDFKMARL